MATTSRLEVKNGDPVAAIQDFLKQVLRDEEVAAVFVPLRLGGNIMPSLVTDPEQLDKADPLAPAFPLNAARHVAKLTRGDMQGMLVAVIRPCEIRAFVELVKLNQGSRENLCIISVDCHGAYANRDWQVILRGRGDKSLNELTLAYLKKATSSENMDGSDGQPPLSRACLACEHPDPLGADLTLGLTGADWQKNIPVIAQSAVSEGLLNRIGFKDHPLDDTRRRAMDALIAKRLEFRDAMFARTEEHIGTPAKLAEYLQDCVNCYNCRVACPVCYCRECVFVTDVFEHEPWQYLGWAKRKGMLRVPVDTMFYHLTRLAHSSTACVGCGQCSNACPNDIPVMDMFRLVAHKTQAIFDYEAGRSVDEAPPLAVFKRDEFAEVTGGVGA